MSAYFSAEMDAEYQALINSTEEGDSLSASDVEAYFSKNLLESFNNSLSKETLGYMEKLKFQDEAARALPASRY